MGIGGSPGGQQNGFTLELGASVGRGNANGKDESWTNTNATAGNVLAIQSGGDTTLKGASAKADQIIASVGGNLLLESLQDSSKYDSKNKSAGFGISLCIPPYCYGSSNAWANAGAGKINSNFKTVTEQTGLWAGDGGFLIDVKNNTTLIGSVIASSDKAVADGLNKLTTGTLVTEDLKNTARYSGSQVSIGGGFGFGGKSGASGLGTTKGGQVAGGASKDAGTSVSTGSSGFGMGTPIVVAASGNSSSTTQSGISGGTIVIRDEAGQLALTGETAAETIAGLNRDTSDTLNALKPIFDKEKIEAGFEIASEAQRQMGQFLTNRAKEADALAKALETETDPQRRQELTLRLADAAKWQPSGEYRRWLTAITGAIAGNVTAPAGQLVQAAAVNYLQGLAASEVKSLLAEMGEGPKADTARAAMHAIVGCAGAVGKGRSCSAGALGAGAGSVLNALLEGDQKSMSAGEKELRKNIIESLVAGIALTAGVDVSDAAFAAVNETENNALSVQQHQSRINEIAQCDGQKECERSVDEKYREISAKQRADLRQCDGVADCNAKIVEANAMLADYDARFNELSEKLRSSGLTPADNSELEQIFATRLLLDVDRLTAAKNGIEAGSDEAKQAAWRAIAEAGLAGASGIGGAIGSSGGKGGGGKNAVGGNAHFNAQEFNGEMLGTRGVQTSSTTLWKGAGSERIDVENPNPGVRAGQIHYQNNDGKKYYYDPNQNVFFDRENDVLAPKSVQKLLDDETFSRAVDKALYGYLGSRR